MKHFTQIKNKALDFSKWHHNDISIIPQPNKFVSYISDTYLTPVSFREEEPENIDQFSYAYDQTDLIDTETSF